VKGPLVDRAMGLELIPVYAVSPQETYVKCTQCKFLVLHVEDSTTS